MKKFLLTATPLLCALLMTKLASAAEAWQRYESYQITARNAPRQLVDPDYLSPRLIANYRAASDETKEQMLGMFAFPNWFARVDSHHEARTARGHCLTVNGYSDEAEWLTASLLYVPAQAGLVLDDADIAFHESQADQPDGAQCPKDARVPLPQPGRGR
ncbi:hypothetical protein [Alkalilimnicola sp. S0819]|uniref:hypothetical protein n=1 Tax=Alkalilimnicola sp. S0819 TaxID=2613922 RepID=UPI0012629102|nr:hypothetical protein [Alkalilimnicola sp. S0819]KAB7627806.1 hypothetical protein F3N43_02180 [Alkalilimnicola sp. S0819]MPQ15436.1 hypothetical protein [Alkalilimnicola sp. S0819]